jgi:subtilisin family serine protease
MGLPRRRRLVAVVGVMAAASLTLPPSGLHGATLSLEASTDAGDRYLVRFASEAEAEGLSGDLARLTTLEALGDSGLEIDNVLIHVFAGAVIAGTAEDVERLRDDPRISAIEPDGVASYHVLDPDRASSIELAAPPSIDETPALSADLLGTQTAPPWGLDRMDQRALPLSNSYTYASAGSGVTVYVVDSGVDPDHVDFGTRLEPGFDALSGTDGRFDCNGHGTHVAGTIAGSTRSFPYGSAAARAAFDTRTC